MNVNDISNAGDMLAELFTPKGGSGHSMGFATVKSVSGAKVTEMCIRDSSQLGTGGKIAAAALAGLAAVSLGGLIGQIPVLGALANSLTGGIIPAIKGVATGFAALSAPAAVAVAAITAVAAIFAYSMATNEAFRNQIIGLASSIASSLAPAFQSLTGLAEPLQGLFAAAVIVVNSFALVITTTLCPIIQQITDLITANMPVIQEVITGVLTVIQTIISTVLPVMVEIFSSTMTAIQAVIDAVWPYISAIVTAAMNAIQAIVDVYKRQVRHLRSLGHPRPGCHVD